MAFYLINFNSAIIIVGLTSRLSSLIMKSSSQMLVSPNPVPANASIKVQPFELPFGSNRYQIINERGELVRKGAISDPSREFSLSVCGMADGDYWLEMGDHRERFTIV